MARVATGIVAAVIVLFVLFFVLVSFVRQWAWSYALNDFQNSRAFGTNSSEYEFITRTIASNSSLAEVQNAMGGAEVKSGPVPNKFGGPEPFVAYFAYFYRGPANLDWLGSNEIFIGEFYWVFFEQNMHPVRIEYECSSTDVQRIEVDLHKMTMKGKLRLPWRQVP